MKINYCLCLNILLFSGCASTVELNSVEEARLKIVDRTAIIHLISDEEYIGKILKVGNESVLFLNTKTGDTLQLSNLSVKFIKVTDHALGAAKGFLIGGVATYAFVTIMDNSRDYNLEGNKPLPSTLTVIFSGVGGLLGLAIGGLIGHPYTYIFPEDSINVGMRTSVDSTDNSKQPIQKSAP
jgi:hypothetical protein